MGLVPSSSQGGGGGGGTVTSVTAGDASIVAGGTAAAVTLETGTLDEIATLHPPAAAVAMNAKKITGLANGTAASDAAAFGQIPTGYEHVSATPGNPAGTASTSAFVMMGLAVAFTPAVSGKARITIDGVLSNVAAAALVQVATGTGVAPINGAAAVGTAHGPSTNSITVASGESFSLTRTVTGLTVGTAIWIDLQAAAGGAGTTAVTNLNVTADEMP